MYTLKFFDIGIKFGTMADQVMEMFIGGVEWSTATVGHQIWTNGDLEARLCGYDFGSKSQMSRSQVLSSRGLVYRFDEDCGQHSQSERELLV